MRATSSGIPDLDELLTGLWTGDNVVSSATEDPHSTRAPKFVATGTEPSLSRF